MPAQAKDAIRVPQREVEALIGGVLLNTVGEAYQKNALKKSKLVPKEIYLPQTGYTMHYHEREAVLPASDAEKCSTVNQPTLLFFSWHIAKKWRLCSVYIKFRHTAAYSRHLP